MSAQAAHPSAVPECGENFLFTAEELIAANVNPRSFLATDYLNHFNQVLMLLDMLPDRPDLMSEVMDWRPRSYCDHFRDTGFAGATIAIAAYMNAPLFIKIPFDRVIAEIEIVILEAQIELNRLKPGEAEGILRAARMALTAAGPLLDQADNIIHARGIDAAPCGITGTQADINALFAGDCSSKTPASKLA